jgi:hypothetical protein
MPWNEETGAFDLLYDFRADLAAGGELADIESDRVMLQLEDLAAALDSLLVSSGRKAVGGNLDFAGNRLIGAGNAAEGSSYVTAKQAAGSAISIGTFNGTANALAATQPYSPTPLPVGHEIAGYARFDNTGAVTYSHNAGTPRAVQDRLGFALAAGAIKAGDLIRLLRHEETIGEETVASWRLQTISRRELDGNFVGAKTNPSTLPRTNAEGLIAYLTAAQARTQLGLATLATTGSYASLIGGIPDLHSERLLAGTGRAASPLVAAFGDMTSDEIDHVFDAIPDASNLVRGKLTPSNMLVLGKIEPVLHSLGADLELAPGTIGEIAGGTEFSFAPDASGGEAPYEIYLLSGDMPPGLSFDPGTASLTGIALSPGGEFDFTLQVRDASGALKNVDYTIVVEDPAISFDETQSHDATAYRPFMHSVAAAIEPSLTYNFQNNNHSFAVNAGSLTAGVNGSVFAQAGADPQLLSPSGLTINGAASRYLRFDIERVSARTTGTWQGTIFYSTAGHAFAGTHYKTFPDLAVGERRVYELDMGALNVGGDDWITSTITRLRFDFDAGGDASIRIHSVRLCDQPSVLTYSLASGALPAGLTLNPTTGMISGSPGAPGTGTTFTVRATDRGGYYADEAFTIGVVAPTLVLNPTSIADRVRTIATTINFTVDGNGSTPYLFERTSGTLPPGLSLNSVTGALSGTPSSNGTFNFTIRATDANGYTATRSYAVVVYTPSITLQPGLISPRAHNVATSITFSVVGNGTAPYTFSVVAGALPTGLTLNATTGVLSGTPTFTGTFDFAIAGTDANGFAAVRTYSVLVAPGAVVVNPSTLTSPVGSASYSATFVASGGTAPYTYSIITGAAPTGLVLNGASGALTGVVIAGGTFNFTVRATDANGFTGDRAYSVTVTSPTIEISPATIDSMYDTQAYSYTITAAGGATPHTFFISSGAVPTGMSFTSSGVLSGTPTARGNHTFTVRATDQNGFQNTRTYTVTVLAGPAIGTQKAVSCTYVSNGGEGNGWERVVSSTGYFALNGSQTQFGSSANFGTAYAGQKWRLLQNLTDTDGQPLSINRNFRRVS